MEVNFYSTSSCPYCKMAKEYLALKGISYKEYDISSDKTAQEEVVKLSGQMGVPVIVINGNIIVGFDKARIDTLLNG
tara:strand:- start:169 stop:399 length:231 start_codon:yes stop_codon:yes gene_type:complete